MIQLETLITTKNYSMTNFYYSKG
ncbi:uncharacterized protein METZ01_LOCUS434326 [marine metagenome]|uniref:Uncharacterized protein n=1 Tax=marine metagenome TaxID=408172 RepID=A0A382YDT6_9ZZZZ